MYYRDGLTMKQIGRLMTLTESGVQQSILARDFARAERLRTLEKVLADFLEKRTAKF